MAWAGNLKILLCNADHYNARVAYCVYHGKNQLLFTIDNGVYTEICNDQQAKLRMVNPFSNKCLESYHILVI